MRSLKKIGYSDLVDDDWYECKVDNYCGGYDIWYFKFRSCNSDGLIGHKMCVSPNSSGGFFIQKNVGILCHKNEIKDGSIYKIHQDFIKIKFNIIL